MWQGLSDLLQGKEVSKMKMFERLLCYLLFLAIASLTYINIQLYYQVEILNYKLDKVVLQVNFLEIIKGHYIVSMNPNKINRLEEKSWN